MRRLLSERVFTRSLDTSFFLENKVLEMLEILDKYELGQTIGKGSYATVAVGKNRTTGKSYAIKIFSDTNFDEELTTKRALREILILKHLTGHENVRFRVDFRLLTWLIVIQTKIHLILKNCMSLWV